MLKGLKISRSAVLALALMAAMAFGFLMGFCLYRGCGKSLTKTSREIAERDAASLPAGFIVQDMNGVDLSGLDDKHRLIAIDLLNRVPCLASAGLISVARCRRDAPSCITSQRMADFIIDKVRKGMGEEEILIALYNKALNEDRVRPKLNDNVTNLQLEGLPFVGPKDAPVTVVLLYDYTGPISQKALREADQLMRLFPIAVRVVYWPWPMTKIRAGAERAAQVALAAGDLGGFDKVHVLLMQNNGSAGDQELADYAEKTAMPSLVDEANSEKVIKRLEALMRTIENLGIEYPPVFFVQGRRISGPVPTVCFLMDVVQEALSNTVRSEYQGLEERIAP